MMEMEENKQGHSSVGMNGLFTAGMTPFLTRTIHPVGHGAFYTEELTGFNGDIIRVVYDCGSKQAIKQWQNIIDSAFTAQGATMAKPKAKGKRLPKEEIEILFVSHLDEDHISGISRLKKKYDVKCVVLPLLKDKTIKNLEFLLALGKTTSKTKESDIRALHSLIYNPQEYWGKDTKIVYVEPYDPETGDINPASPKNLAELKTGETIKSFQALNIGVNFFDKGGDKCCWKYIPFNFDEKNRTKQFKKLVDECPALKQFPDIASAVFRGCRSKEVSALKCIYRQIGETKEPSRLNSNSLMVYSGSVESFAKDSLTVCREEDDRVAGEKLDSMKWEQGKNAACLYLGDADLVNTDVLSTIRIRLQAELPQLDMIQVPHHGSVNSYNHELQELNPDVEYYFLSHSKDLVSCGKGKHPFPDSQVTADFQSPKRLLCISEDPDTTCKMEYRIM